MNVFVIPSWYPSRSEPIAGIFTYEQAQAIAELNCNINVIVSKWGHDDTYLSIRKPWDWLSKIYNFLRSERSSTDWNGDVLEINRPTLHWSHRLPFGGAPQLIAANRISLQEATIHSGTINLIHAHVSYPAGYIASVLSREFNIPYVLTEHMGPFPLPGLMRDGKPIREISSAFSDATACIAVSQALAEEIERLGYPTPEVIPNLVNERAFAISPPKRSKFSFFTMAKICHEKGIDDLLDAIASWDPPSDKFEFRIAGGGPSLDEYKARASKLGIADRVDWLGPVDRQLAAQLFQGCHAFVLPSRHESFGIVFAEALACGKPIIATRCGGPESIVTPLNGLQVAVGDIRELANAMKTLSSTWSNYDPNVIRADFERRFSRTAVTKQIIRIYDRSASLTTHRTSW